MISSVLCKNRYFVMQSSPQFEPVKMVDTDKSSDGETDDNSSVKSVRFNKVAEVSFLHHFKILQCCMINFHQSFCHL